jgi:sulfite reductase (NADPH) flavoprotein alpha-component
MIPANLKRRLLTLHRWLAIGLAPVFLLVVLSGAVLALKPMVESSDGTATAQVGVGTVAEALDRLDPAARATGVSISADGSVVEVRSTDPAVAGSFDIATGTPVADRAFDPFELTLSLHRNLLVGAGLLVEIAAYAMVAILAFGLVLGLPRLRNTLRGWHVGLGWLALPLVALTPVTGMLLALHIGRPALPAIAPGEPVALARAVELVAREDAGAFSMARRFRGGAAMVKTASSEDERAYLVQPNGKVVPLAGGPGWVEAVHEGTWAGAWSGLLNLLSGLGLAFLIGTGLYAWWSRQRSRRVRASGAIRLRPA